MNPRLRSFRLILAATSLACGFVTGCMSPPSEPDEALVGAWRGKVQFTNGAYAAVKDLEFLYVFNEGGTMLESSNYDGSPPVAPAYGAWRSTGPRTFAARYEYFWTKPPANFDELAKGGGWAPGGRGVLTQSITLAADGNAFDSTIRYEVFDAQGKPTDPASSATGHGERIKP
jgi:hypothetical protein